MSTNRALINSLECYMDELVDSFEDFVKKSLLLISAGIGTIVLLFVYMLKVLRERTGTSNTGVNPGCRNLRSVPSCTSMRSSRPKTSATNRYIDTTRGRCTGGTKARKTDSLFSSSSQNRMQNRDCQLMSSSANNENITSVPSCDEQYISDYKFTNFCPKNLAPKKRPCSKYSATRLTIPSLPSCPSNPNVSPPRNCAKTKKRTSCCSLCCVEDLKYHKHKN